jgi:transketolase N-terminal domain/subunit
MSVLFFNAMKYSISEPRGDNNDRFVLSKVKPGSSGIPQ